MKNRNEALFSMVLKRMKSNLKIINRCRFFNNDLEIVIYPDNKGKANHLDMFEIAQSIYDYEHFSDTKNLILR